MDAVHLRCPIPSGVWVKLSQITISEAGETNPARPLGPTIMLARRSRLAYDVEDDREHPARHRRSAGMSAGFCAAAAGPEGVSP
jgi:hypothetical protein